MPFTSFITNRISVYVFVLVNIHELVVCACYYMNESTVNNYMEKLMLRFECHCSLSPVQCVYQGLMLFIHRY